MAVADWRQQFEDLQHRKPELAERVCRRLLLDMQHQGLVDLDELDNEIAVALRLVGKRTALDPNRPKPQLPAKSHLALYDLALKYEQHIISHHEHHLAKGWSRSGKYVIINNGGLFDQDKLQFAVLTDSRAPMMKQGFTMLKNGVGTLFGPTPFTDWSLWL